MHNDYGNIDIIMIDYWNEDFRNLVFSFELDLRVYSISTVGQHEEHLVLRSPVRDAVHKNSAEPKAEMRYDLILIPSDDDG